MISSNDIVNVPEETLVKKQPDVKAPVETGGGNEKAVTTGQQLAIDAQGNRDLTNNVIQKHLADKQRMEAEQIAQAGAGGTEQNATDYAVQYFNSPHLDAEKTPAAPTNVNSAVVNEDNETVQTQQANNAAARYEYEHGGNDDDEKYDVPALDAGGSNSKQGSMIKTEPVVAGIKPKTYDDILAEWRAQKDADDAEYKKRKRKAAVIQGVLGAIEAVGRFAAKGGGQNVSPQYMQNTQKDILTDWQQKRKDNDAMFQSRLSDMYKQEQQAYQQKKDEQTQKNWEATYRRNMAMDNVKIRDLETKIQNNIDEGDIKKAKKKLLEMEVELEEQYAGTDKYWEVQNKIASYRQKIAAAEKSQKGSTKTYTQAQLDKQESDAITAKEKAKQAKKKSKIMGIDDDEPSSSVGSGGSGGSSGNTGGSGGQRQATKSFGKGYKKGNDKDKKTRKV